MPKRRRHDIDAPWEQTNRAEQLRKAAGLTEQKTLAAPLRELQSTVLQFRGRVKENAGCRGLLRRDVVVVM